MEVKLTQNLEDDTRKAVYQASLNGGVGTLNTLNLLDLSRVSFSPFGESPLHIAALLGHLELCQVLLDKKPSLASEVDSEGRCPLHLASAEGHAEVVKALLMTNPDICLTPDKDGKLPLHFAASRGHIGPIELLISTKPCSIRMMTDDGSVLHLCVKYKHMEALKFLVQSVRGAKQLLPAIDKDGNTALHLAARLREIKTIRYLLSLPEMRTAANALNRTGLTALEVLDLCPRDFISLTVEHILIEAGVQRLADITCLLFYLDQVKPTANKSCNFALGKVAQENKIFPKKAQRKKVSLPARNITKKRPRSSIILALILNIHLMEMELASNLQGGTMKELFEASINGCVSTLNALIEKNPLILSRVSLSPMSETPLHIASLLGHLEFCQVLLDRKPSLASEVDLEGRCPLHLASAEGHTEIVKALSLTNPESCLTKDKDDKLPLHFAIMRGRMGTIKELTSASPDSIENLTDDGSILHLCIRYNHLEALKFIVESVRGDKQLLLLAKDKQDKTVLHLAVMHKQIKTINFLLSLPEVRTAANALNSTGFTALDLLERCPKDFISLTIEHILIEAGVQRSADIATAHSPLPPSPRIANEAQRQHQHGPRDRIKNFFIWYLLNRGNRIADMRGALIVAATVIAAMTFLSVINPPGGVWQEDTMHGGDHCTTYGFCEAGTAVVGYRWSQYFLKFVYYNSASFFLSLFVVLVLICGLPYWNKFMMWMLTTAMAAAVSCMLFAYIWALGLVSPPHIYHNVNTLDYLLIGIWLFILVGIGSIQSIRSVLWLRQRRRL